jgi:hypothetical protein
MIYIEESFHMTDEARMDQAFLEWLHRFNALGFKNNPAVKSINAYSAYTGGYELEVWFELEDFTALDQSEAAERAMFQNPEVMNEFITFTKYLRPISRKIMRSLI